MTLKNVHNFKMLLIPKTPRPWLSLDMILVMASSQEEKLGNRPAGLFSVLRRAIWGPILAQKTIRLVAPLKPLGYVLDSPI